MVLACTLHFLTGGQKFTRYSDRGVLPCVLALANSAVTVKRLHDRGRSGAWAFLMIVAWMLLAGNWAILPGVWQWAGRFVPTLILVMMLNDLGAFVGT